MRYLFAAKLASLTLLELFVVIRWTSRMHVKEAER